MNPGRLGILDRYLLKELLLNFFYSLLFLSLLVGIVSATKAVHSGYSIGIVLPWLRDSLLYSLYFTTPISILVACTLVFGRFVTDREFTAALASGISPYRLLAPVAALAVPVGVLMLLTQSTILPELQHRKQDLGRFLVKQLENLGEGKMGQLRLDDQGGVVHWYEIRGGRDLTEVYIEKQLRIGSDSTGGTGAIAATGELGQTPATKILAKRAQLTVDDEADVIRLTLVGVDMKFPVSEVAPEHRDFLDWRFETILFDQFNVDFPINSTERRLNDLPTTELKTKIAENLETARLKELEIATAEDPAIIEPARQALALAQRTARRGDTEIWRRRAMALAVLTFSLLGFPIALLSRSSQKLVPFFFGILAVMALFFPLTYGGIQFSRATGAPAWATVMSGNYVLAAIALFLLTRLRTIR
ncbi:MAG: LptF/LptG family permease [Planctomycetota bacterium]